MKESHCRINNFRVSASQMPRSKLHLPPEAVCRSNPNPSDPPPKRVGLGPVGGHLLHSSDSDFLKETRKCKEDCMDTLTSGRDSFSGFKYLYQYSIYRFFSFSVFCFEEIYIMYRLFFHISTINHC